MKTLCLFHLALLALVSSQSIEDFVENNILNNLSLQYKKEAPIVLDDATREKIAEKARQQVEEKSQSEQIDNLAQLYILKPCLARTCDKGAMCVVTSDDLTLGALNRTTCACPEECSSTDLEEQVCTKDGFTYPSKCALHMKACEKGVNIDVAYEGACVAKSGKCSVDDLIAFTPRFMEWMVMVREEYMYGEANMQTNMVDVPQDEQLHVVQWMFKYLDTNKDGTLGPKEIASLLDYLMSVEHCVKEFIYECDLDGNNYIFPTEWKICMQAGSNSVEDTFFDKL